MACCREAFQTTKPCGELQPATSNPRMRLLFSSPYTAWSKANRPATLRLPATGKHGFGFRNTGVAADPWPDHLAAWLRTRKLL